jgi:hypothetical protein
MTDWEPDRPEDDRPLPDLWIQAARSTYHPPGETPREDIWRDVEERLFPASPPISRRPSTPWIPILAAASLVLLLGVALGRWSVPGGAVTEGEPVAAAPPPAATGTSSNAGVRFATARHLNDAEALLDFVSTDARQGRVDRDLARWGSGLLTQTRLLLDSSVSDDPGVRGVLEDLEIVLSQIAFLGDSGFDTDRLKSELQLIADGVSDGRVRRRIRSVLPSMVPQLSAADDDGP